MKEATKPTSFYVGYTCNRDYTYGRLGHLANTCPQRKRNYTPRSEYQASQRTVRQPSPCHYFALSVAQAAVAPQSAPHSYNQAPQNPNPPPSSASQPFRFRRAVPAIVPEHSSVQPIISPTGVWLAAQKNLTDATGWGVVNPTQGLPAQNFLLKLDEKQFNGKIK